MSKSESKDAAIVAARELTPRLYQSNSGRVVIGTYVPWLDLVWDGCPESLAWYIESNGEPEVRVTYGGNLGFTCDALFLRDDLWKPHATLAVVPYVQEFVATVIAETLEPPLMVPVARYDEAAA